MEATGEGMISQTFTHPQEDIQFNTFDNLIVNDGKKYLQRENLVTRVIPVASIETLMALGAIHFSQSEEIGLKAMGVVLAGASIGLQLGYIKETFSNRLRVLDGQRVYPYEIKIPDEKFKGVMIDGVRGFFQNISKLKGLRSVVDYKNKAIEHFGKNVNSETKAGILWDSMIKTQDPLLKLILLKSIEKNCKKYLSGNVISNLKNGEISTLEQLAGSYLIMKWNLGSNFGVEESQKIFNLIENLDSSTIIKNATLVSNEIITNFPDTLPKTLAPFIKLFALRRITEEISKNNLTDFASKDFIEKTKNEILQEIGKFDVLTQEKEYHPESATIGMEMQPYLYNISEFKTVVSRTSPVDLDNINSYLGFIKSPDQPFEIVFPPTKTPAAQLLMLREILILTGIPIELSRVQISFGGIGEQTTITALQRIILSAGRLDPNWNLVSQRGAWWSLDMPHKGEVDIKSLDDMSTKDDVVKVNPIDSSRPEFKHVGEMRSAPIAQSFFVFARGMLEGYRLANLAKAYERQQHDNELTGVELEMAKKYMAACSRMNEILKTGELPKVDQEWSNDHWKKFSDLVNTPETSAKFRGILSDTLS